MKLYIRLILLLTLFAGIGVSCDDDDTVTTGTGGIKVNFGTPFLEVSENVSPQRIPLILSQAATQDVTVKVAIKSEDGAREGIDYKLLTPEVVIPKNEIGGYVEVAIQDYFELKADRIIVLELMEIVGAEAGNDVQTCRITIISNEGYPILGFHETVMRALEEEPEITVPVTLNRPAGKDVTFKVTADDETAIQPDHYILPDTSYTIPAGDTVAHIKINIKDDINVNENRKFTLRLTEAAEAQISEIKAAVQITIVNDDAEVYASFKDTKASIYEDERQMKIAVTLNTEPQKEVRVKVSVNETSTAPQSDYTLPEQMELIFPVGVTQQEITLGINDNELQDGNRTLVLDLIPVENAVITEDKAQYTLTINDEDIDFISLYDNMMGEWTLEMPGSKDLPASVTITVSGGETLEEENANYLKRFVVSCPAFGSSAFPAKWMMDYDMETGEITIPMGQVITTNVSFGGNLGICDVLWYWLTQGSDGEYRDTPVKLTPDKGYKTLTFEKSLCGRLQNASGLTQTYWFLLNNGVMKKN